MIAEFRSFLEASHGLIVSGPMPFVRSQLDKWRKAALDEQMRLARYEERDGQQCLVRSLDFERWQHIVVCLARLQMNRRTNSSAKFTDQERASEVQKLFNLLPDPAHPGSGVDDWQEATTGDWATWFDTSARNFTNWVVGSKDWIKPSPSGVRGHYSVNVKHPEAIAKRLKAEKAIRKRNGR